MRQIATDGAGGAPRPRAVAPWHTLRTSPVAVLRRSLADRVRLNAMPALALIVGAVILLWALGHVIEVVLLAFAGVLFAVYLRGLAGLLAARTPLGGRVAAAAVCLVIVAIVVAAALLLAPGVARQIDELASTLPQALTRLGDQLDDYGWGHWLQRQLEAASGALDGAALARAGRLLSSGFGALTGLVVVLFVTLFIAFEPDLYRRGLLRLAPLAARPRLEAVLGEVGHVLWRWMLGKTLSMVLVGVLTWVGLALLGVPLAMTLAIFAALVIFVPYVGPVIAVVPALLLAMLSGADKVLYVALLYTGIQVVETYLVEPLIERKSACLPPALTLLAQVALGLFAGGIGVVLAAPLTAATLVLIKRLYVEDVLGDRGDEAPAT
jgi:predicted PurR-regulated permease PerM